MSKIDVIRAWKDAEYRNSLSAAERAQLPENPAGLIEVGQAELVAIDGGTGTMTGCPDKTFTILAGCTKGGFNPTIYINPGFRLGKMVVQPYAVGR